MGKSVDREKIIDVHDSPYGAIFMANRTTKKECLGRKLFGLPSPQVRFVEKIKCGTVLFLFEYEERKLYGVFQAVSDGGINIVPHAFESSRMQFPAQIRFKSIWNCKPLSEHDFRDAIRGNYYTANKFNLGLSKHQVSKLLRLFDSRRIRIQKVDRPVPNGNSIDRPVSRDYCSVEKAARGGFDKNITERKSLSFGDHMLSSFENAISPSSKRKFASFNLEDQERVLSSKKRIRSDSLDISDFGDFIPLDPIKCSLMNQQPCSSGCVPSSKQVSLAREKKGRSLSPSKHPPYVPDHPSLQQLSFLRESLSPSLIPSKHSPYVLDYYCLANAEGSPYLDLQTSATTTSSHKPSEERDENGVYTALHSDIEGKRISVFERLKEDKEPYDAHLLVKKMGSAGNNAELLDDDGTSVDEIMDSLERCKKDRTISTEESRKGKVKYVDDAKSGIKSIELEGASEEEQFDVVYQEMPVSFNRRKMQSDINKGIDVSSRTLIRRKLKRPSFVKEEAQDKEVISESLIGRSEFQASQSSGFEVDDNPVIHHDNNKTEFFQDKGEEMREENRKPFIQNLEYNGHRSETMAGSQDFKGKVKGFIQELTEDIH